MIESLRLKLRECLVMLVVSGHRFIGEDDECELYVKQKIEKWVQCVAGLSKAAESQPQAAFAALVKSIQCEWRFLQRVIPNCSILFSPLSDIIKENSSQVYLAAPYQILSFTYSHYLQD